MNVIRVKLGNVKNVAILSPEIQLLMATRDESVTNIVRLYSNGASGNAIDENGNNLLHIAVKTGNVQVIQAILLFYARPCSLLTKRNKDGKHPRDLTFSVEVLRCMEMIENGILSSSSSSNEGDTDVKEEVERFMRKCAMETKLKMSDKENEKILLSLDGGGVRGLVLIRMMMHLERKLGAYFWEQIDWVCGTSTGAIVALALSKGYSLDYVQKLYLRLKTKIFFGPRPYNARLLETFLKEELGLCTMNDVKRPKVLATSCLTHVAPPKLKLFRNYKPKNTLLKDSDWRVLGYDDPECVPMWKAARCSSAAPTYFSPFEEIYSDGGIIANNPTLELMTEFFRYHSIILYQDQVPTERIGCVISLGTGIAPVAKMTLNQTKMGHLLKTISKYGEYLKNMVTVFLKQITASDGSVVDESLAWCNSLSVPFFRFSPPLRANIDLDETNDRILIDLMWDTEYYLVTQASDQMRELTNYIRRLKNCGKKVVEKHTHKQEDALSTTSSTSSVAHVSAVERAEEVVMRNLRRSSKAAKKLVSKLRNKERTNSDNDNRNDNDVTTASRPLEQSSTAAKQRR